ncbi:MAG TPA: hypothetical protein PLN52_06035 [Opitutaceae bacterium]|nr:hypothetical protein [Opitutaceae bacterium]
MIIPTASRRIQPTLWQRWVAYASVGLVVALGLLAVSPDVHAWLHASDLSHVHGTGDRAVCHGHGDSAPHVGGDFSGLPMADTDAGCVIELFSQGIETGPTGLVVGVYERREAVLSLRLPAELCLSTPRYLRQPERGPPPSGLRVGSVGSLV